MIAGGWIHTVLGQQTWPGVGQEPAHFVTLLFVGGVVDMLSALVDQQAAELQDQVAHVVAGAERIVRIDDV